MTEITNKKQYDLEDRTLQFAKSVRIFVKMLPKTTVNVEDSKQVIRSSGSIGANYIEANEALSKKDFVMRIKICRKEAKETKYWLEIIDTNNDKVIENEKRKLLNEATELIMIMSAIMRKSM